MEKIKSINLEEIEEQIVLVELRGEKIVKYLDMYNVLL
jgi:penicillin-binding protein-related factor A (putative recombinase)